MSDHHTPPAPIAEASEQQFLRLVLARIDAGFDDEADLDDLGAARDMLRRRLASTAASGDSEGGDPVVALLATELHRLRRTRSEGGDPVVALLATELHRLRRARMAATVITRAGHVHDHVRIQAVHRHHTVLTRAGEQAGVLLPLRFIESVRALGGGTPEAVSTEFSHRKEC
ncbi:hypothetical protein [Nocardia araoensis]|uniref:hypothetical protein n=1 Tax=Nocardia araoensis TaxID=228600 RepID=UPI00058480F4|nr:hypothetical protein [Nocardia araoensis]